MKETIDAETLFEYIVDTIAEWDGEALEEVANQILSAKVKYLEDSMFDLEWQI